MLSTRHRNFKDFPRRTISDNVLHNKAFNIAINSKYDGYQRGIPSLVCKCLDKKSSGGAVKSGIIPNQQLAEELHKTIIRKFEKRKIY